MIIDSEDLKELSECELEKLKIYFKSFKELDLKDAAEKIFSSEETPLIWKRYSENEFIEIDVRNFLINYKNTCFSLIW